MRFEKRALTEIPVSAVGVLARYLNFCLCDDAREFSCGTLRGIIDAGYIPIPFQSGPRYPARARTVGKGGRILGDGKRDATRHIFEYVAVLNFVPRRRIKLRHSLEDALRDFGSRTRLENTLQVVIAPMHKHLVLYHIPENIRGTLGKKEEANR